VLAVLAVVVWFVAAPLRSRPAGGSEGSTGSPEGSRPTGKKESERADLDAAKEAKYREIRDAELDYRTGKLSREDWKRLDAELRAEAMELLRRLDEEA
jgi:hypothetical protein